MRHYDQSSMAVNSPMGRNPRARTAIAAFTLVAAGTLALGIAVNTIAFTLLNSLALRPMPVRDAAREHRARRAIAADCR